MPKVLSNPFSTGHGGSNFEAQVQTSFTVLMLCGGFSPCLPQWPIVKLKLQARHEGYETDDMIVYAENPNSKEVNKLLCQIKHSIAISKKSRIFAEVIEAAWNDYNNSEIFRKKSDKICLITCLLNANDVKHTRIILEWARTCDNYDDFFSKISLAKFSSKEKVDKLEAFRTQIEKINKNITNEEFFAFLQHFYLLGYDLDIKSGVMHSLMYTLIGQFNTNDTHGIWTQIFYEIEVSNKHAKSVTKDNIPEELKEYFLKKVTQTIPSELISNKPQEHTPSISRNFAIANLFGAWDENNEFDTLTIKSLLNENYENWLEEMRAILVTHNNHLKLSGTTWTVINRIEIWKNSAQLLHESDLERFKELSIKILKENDPEFELPCEKRFAASLYNKKSKYSFSVRKGIAETIALLGCQSAHIKYCRVGFCENIAREIVHELLHNASWLIWGSLNNLLPYLAEAAPRSFLAAIEMALDQSPSPIAELFLQESAGITGRTYMTGVLWSLEALAWSQDYLLHSVEYLGRLAEADPGGNWGNRPANSLRNILLPWFPQTLASPDIRIQAIKNLKLEAPSAFNKLLISLLPSGHSTTSGTYKPNISNIVEESWKPKITDKEYWEQIGTLSDLAVDEAENNEDYITILAQNIEHLPQPSFDRYISLITPQKLSKFTEDTRNTIWKTLNAKALKHAKYSEAFWALRDDLVQKIQTAADKIAPSNLLSFYNPLFSDHDSELYEKRGNWREQSEALERKRQRALLSIIGEYDIYKIIEFTQSVSAPNRVGYSLGKLDVIESDSIILPDCLDSDDRKISIFACNYVRSKFTKYEWTWIDQFDTSKWSHDQIGIFLSTLPFTSETWKRVQALLQEHESKYWTKVLANPHEDAGGLAFAVDNLLKYNRPAEAIECLHAMNIFDAERTSKALLSALSSQEQPNQLFTYYVEELIERLQNSKDADINDLIHIEWAFLGIFDRSGKLKPVTLENKLATDPDFFCEVIRSVYRSANETDEQLRGKSDFDKKVAENCYELLRLWRTPPGTTKGKAFSKEKLTAWHTAVEQKCAETGHIEVAMIHFGNVLFYSPSDPDGLWIHKDIASLLNKKSSEYIRRGYRTEAFNSRGAYWADPTGSDDRKISEGYKYKASELIKVGFHRFAMTLQSLSKEYENMSKERSSN